eukprot:CAMPEP_0184855722 /NCGR_PEP_ID=MMETSP0580-20130426/865_1 /TAXON_ID=1118495 /ORGANISM="Dactyliosolen fragilissimus" /LENGTH=399 /DNA_ID=CAMNT_0027350297 /DNA_START=38 /DNA_END=1237 /DNA_ORIENTATION=-
MTHPNFRYSYVTIFALLSAVSTTLAFTPSTILLKHANFHNVQNSLLQSKLFLSSTDPNDGQECMDRRKVMHRAASSVAAATAWALSHPNAIAQETSESSIVSTISTLAPMGTDASHPIAVIGAGGKVGSICTKILNRKNLYSTAITRSGRKTLEDDSQYVGYGSGDVTSYESIKKVVDGSSGVIFAASASGKKKGGDPAHVDYLGLYNTAKACIECGVPKLVVVSAGSVTRPDFIGFKATNFFVKYVYGDNIMGYKIAGESVMRDLYAQQPSSSKCSYCVVRPGGLSDSPAEGPGEIHVSQGDVYSAEITREDVAEVTVAALLKGSSTDFTTFELNKIKGLAKVSDKLQTPPEELVHFGSSTYEALLDGLKTDNDMILKYPQYMNTFTGDKIEPVSAVV